MTEEINSETAEAPAETVETGGFKNPPLPHDETIRRGVPSGAPESDPGRRGVPSGAPESDPGRRGVPSGAPEKTADAGGFKNPPLRGAPEKPYDAGKLAELETALNETRQSLAARTGDYDRLKAALDDTVSAYRKLAVSSSPLYSDDMISGSSVEEIDASIKKVNGLVKKMRSTLEAELKDLTIPAGAPERSAPDLSGLSPRDKIKYGIQEKK
jgi:hypothetical protein